MNLHETYAGMPRADELGFSDLVIDRPEGQGIEVALFDPLAEEAQERRNTWI
jgi:hypothetical protein